MKCSKKRTLQFNDVVEGDSSNSDEDADERRLCDDSSDYYDIDDGQLEDIELPDCSALNATDFVLTKFTTKKAKVMYVGQVQSRIVDADENTFAVKFMRREKPKSFTFIFPNMEDISEVLFEDVVAKLPNPIQHGGTARVARHMIFPVNLSLYSNMLR